MADDYPKDMQKTFIDVTKNSFKDLCETLQNEQQRLRELEARREHLSENMKLLRQQLDEQNKALKRTLAESSLQFMHTQAAQANEDAPSCSKELEPKNVSMDMDQKLSTPLNFKTLEFQNKNITPQVLINDSMSAQPELVMKNVSDMKTDELVGELESKCVVTEDVKKTTMEEVD